MAEGEVWIEFYDSPLGTLEVTASQKGIRSIALIKEKKRTTRANHLTRKCIDELTEYFAGSRRKFDLPLDFDGAPYFYREVWRTMCSIPFGRTRSYEDIAIRLGKPGAVRVVGMANAHNPIPIVVPCHRVIGKDGSLTGYAYGVEMKHKLLHHENPARFADQGVLFEELG